MTDENHLIKERLKKITDLREAGINPYPYDYQPNAFSTQIIQKHKNIAPDEHSKESYSIAGRVMQKRVMGKASFATLQDNEGKIQIFLTQDNLGKELYKMFDKKIDLGDFVGVKGNVFRTKKGEISLNANKIIILAKAIRPLPEKYHGLKDTEQRYRKRHLDLIMNPEVKQTFLLRSRLITFIRKYLNGLNFVEVETPVLQPIYGGASAKPFQTHHNTLDMPLFLRISDELYLKRLIVGGFDRVYEIGKDFRNEGVDTQHNPEFTMIEWYEAYGDYHTGMERVEKLVESTAKELLGTTKIKYQGKEYDVKTPWKRQTLADSIKEHAGIDVLKMTAKELQEYCDKNNIEYAHNATWGLFVQAVFEETTEEKLVGPIFITDHPAETTPLCKLHRSGDERLVERFELFWCGFELANAYSELNDPLLQKEFFELQVERGRGGEDETHPYDNDFIEAIEQGMPPTSGVGLGIDRLAMIFADVPSIRDVLLFPTMRFEDKKKESRE
ncbi:lysine--tRNA ligase [Candidatus Woesearchaeota archaeon]|nr:lysine--tRNA ligase [Candidatus Woesearchaeota archaeon]